MHLTLDSSLGAGSAALYNGGELLSFASIDEKGMQAKQLVPTISRCLEENDTEIRQLETIYCTVGPGGFTGIRIALATAKAFGFTMGMPVVGVSTLACMAAESESTEGTITPILPAARGKVYAQRFEAATLKPLDEARLLNLEELDASMELVQLASSDIKGLELQTQKIDTIDARSIGKLIGSENFEEYHARAAEALYIRPPDAKLPQK